MAEYEVNAVSLFYLVPPNFPKHVHIYARRVEQLRARHIRASMVCFVDRNELEQRHSELTALSARWGVGLQTVPQGYSASAAMLRYFRHRILLRRPTVVHALKTDIVPLAPIRRLARLLHVPFGILVELEGDIALESLYLRTHALAEGRLWIPDSTSLREYEALVARDQAQMESADAVVLMSERHAELWHGRGHMGNYIVLPPLFDESQRYDDEARQRLRETWGVGNALVIAYTGGVRYAWQRFEHLLDLTLRIRRSGRDARMVAFVISDDLAIAEQAIYRHSASAYARASHIDPATLGEHLSACDLAVFPRHVHPMNLIVPSAKLGEYLVAGLPVITTGAHALYGSFIRRSGAGMFVDESLEWPPGRDQELDALVLRAQDPKWRSGLAESLVSEFLVRDDPYGRYADAVKALLSRGSTHGSPQGSRLRARRTSIAAEGTRATGTKPDCALSTLVVLPTDSSMAVGDACPGMVFSSSCACEVVRYRPSSIGNNSSPYAGERVDGASLIQDLGADPSGTWGEAYRRSRGEWVLFLADTDRLAGDCSERLEELVQQTRSDMIILTWRHDGRFVDPALDQVCQLGGLAVRHLAMHSGAIPSAAVVFRRALAERVTGLDDAMSSDGAVWDLLVRAARMEAKIEVARDVTVETSGWTADTAADLIARFEEGIRIIRRAHAPDARLGKGLDVMGPCPCAALAAQQEWAAECARIALRRGHTEVAVQVLGSVQFSPDQAVRAAETILEDCLLSVGGVTNTDGERLRLWSDGMRIAARWGSEVGLTYLAERAMVHVLRDITDRLMAARPVSAIDASTLPNLEQVGGTVLIRAALRRLATRLTGRS